MECGIRTSSLLCIPHSALTLGGGVLPADLPEVAISGTPERFRREDVPEGGHWEWLRVRLAGRAGTSSEFAVFDPDHACPPGLFGQPCKLAVELFHPALGPNPNQERYLTPTGAGASIDAPPVAAGRVLDYHRTAWRYTGPVTTEEEVNGERRRVVRHVMDAPQLTLRLVVDIGIGTVLVQLRDPLEAPPVGAWTTLRDARVELIAIANAERGVTGADWRRQTAQSDSALGSERRKVL